MYPLNKRRKTCTLLSEAYIEQTASLLIEQYSREQVGGQSIVFNNIINSESTYTGNKNLLLHFSSQADNE